MNNVGSRESCSVAGDVRGDGVEYANGLAGQSVAVCPREPGSGGYFSTAAWSTVYPDVLKEYYRTFGRFGFCESGGLCAIGNPVRVASLLRGVVDGDGLVDEPRDCGDSPCAGVDEQCFLGGEGRSESSQWAEKRVRGEESGTRRCAGGSVAVSPRGPNYLRNQANRLKQKQQALARKADYLQLVESSVKKPAAGVQRSGVEQELHDLRVERQIIQEKRKLEKLKSPTQMIEDAMRQVAMAERCAKLANDSKVAKWAADLSSASAESIARSAGADVRVVESRSAGRSGSVVGGSSTRGSVGRKSAVFVPSVAGVSATGKSVTTDGVEFTRATAGRWLARYSYLEKYAGEPEAEVARLGGITLGEVKKYYRLKEEFSL